MWIFVFACYKYCSVHWVMKVEGKTVWCQHDSSQFDPKVVCILSLLREKKLSRSSSLKVLDYAMQGSDAAENCAKFVDFLGLRSLFPLFMKVREASSTRASFHLDKFSFTSFVCSCRREKWQVFPWQVSLVKSWHASFSTRRLVKENFAYFFVHTGK